MNHLIRIIELLRNHHVPQIWNTVKFVMARFKGFSSTYLTYRPVYLVLFITSRCNMACGMCPYFSPNRQSNLLEFEDMPMDIFKSVVKRFNQAIELTLSGGEPLLHSRVFDMIDYAHEHRMRVKAGTNGLTIHRMLDKIVRSPLSWLNISLNACNSDEFVELQGGSKQAYNILLEDIAKLVEKRNRYNKHLKIVISYVCTKANYKNIPRMVCLAENLGVDEINFLNLIPYGIPGFLEDQCLYDDDPDVFEFIRNVLPSKQNLTVYMPKLYKRKITKRKCDTPFKTLSVDAQGNISPCCQIAPQASYGNVFSDGDAWNYPNFLRKREMLINQSLPLPDFCKTCHGLVTGRIMLKG